MLGRLVGLIGLGLVVGVFLGVTWLVLGRR